jgi:tetratricopeptide (TPR) repeat protein
MIVVTPQQYVRTESRCNEHQEPLASTKIFLHNFLLVWNWEKSLGNLQDQNTLVPEHLTIASNKAVRLCDMALVLGNMKEYEEAEKRLQEAIEGFEEEFEKENPHTLIYKSQQQLKEAGDLFLQAIRIIKHVLGIDHQNTLDRIANIVSICLDHGYSSTRDQEMVTILTDRIRNNIQITEEEMVWVTRSFGKEIMLQITATVAR